MYQHMARGRWRVSAEMLAVEAFLVLIKREAASKTYSRKKLTSMLVIPDARVDFLKLCLEYDDSDSLEYFRKGLFLCIKAIGPSEFAKKVRVNRVSLYRMLGKGGNPSLRYMIRISGALGLRFWAMEESIILDRNELQRPKSIIKDIELFEKWMNDHWGPGRWKSKKAPSLLVDEDPQEDWPYD